MPFLWNLYYFIPFYYRYTFPFPTVTSHPAGIPMGKGSLRERTSPEGILSDAKDPRDGTFSKNDLYKYKLEGVKCYFRKI